MLSTLHTRGTVESLLRLIDMGCEPCLVKEVVTSCKEPYQPAAEDVDAFLSDSSYINRLTFFRPRGCEERSHTGYARRTAISEVLYNNRRNSGRFAGPHDRSGNPRGGRPLKACAPFTPTPSTRSVWA